MFEVKIMKILDACTTEIKQCSKEYGNWPSQEVSRNLNVNVTSV